jgi:hypothetical protein
VSYSVVPLKGEKIIKSIEEGGFNRRCRSDHCGTKSKAFIATYKGLDQPANNGPGHDQAADLLKRTLQEEETSINLDAEQED